MTGKTEQPDFDDLSAWLDGELEDDRAEQVKRAAAPDGDLGQVHRELRELDEMLNTLTVPPAPAGLAERIIARTRRAARRRLVVRVVRWAAPVAAAAAVVIAVALHISWPPHQPPTTTPPVAIGDQPGKIDRPKDVAKASFFADFDVLENYDTLEAMEKFGSEAKGM